MTFSSPCVITDPFLKIFMDLYVERQCIDEMKDGKVEKFLLLFDANFEELYRYVYRRVSEIREVERIVRLTFLDALGQMNSTPTDVSYLVWLYSLAKPRVWENIAKESVPEKRGLISVAEGAEMGENLSKLEKMMGKLSLEEREIIRLKFFEQVTDGDVMTVLGIEEGTVGTKIYRVLKRSHFLIFGEREGNQGVYFGELSGLFETVREHEEEPVFGAFKLNLKSDLDSRMKRKEFAVEADFVEEKPRVSAKGPKLTDVGSKDPAKIFVQAVKDLTDEEKREIDEQRQKVIRRENLYDLIDQWKTLFFAIPLVLFLAVTAYVIMNIFPTSITRGYVNTCDVEVVFDGEFSDGEMRGINKGVSDRICDHFEVKKLIIKRNEDASIAVNVDVPDWLLEYKFVKKIKDWRIKKYERTLSSNDQRG